MSYDLKETLAPPVATVRLRRVLNSYGRWISEFVVELEDGSRGRGASPRGETMSIYETAVDDAPGSCPFGSGEVVDRFHETGCQREFDAVLRPYREVWGQHNTFGLSLAYFYAARKARGERIPGPFDVLQGTTDRAETTFPRLLVNVLNGGRHAYTNPVLSDFHEYLLVPQENDPVDVLAAYRAVSARIRERLAALPCIEVSGNPVHCHRTRDNRVWFDLLLDVLQELKLEDAFSIMVDASAGDLFDGSRYTLSLTDGGSYTSEAFVAYWSRLLSAYPISILEDPFAEWDEDAWGALQTAFPDRFIAGDNLCSTDADRIARAARRRLVSAVLIKPDQAGTVTDAVSAMQTARDRGLVPIPSHRSAETEHTFLCDLAYYLGAPYMKIGLFSEYTTILKMNALLRYYGTTEPVV